VTSLLAWAVGRSGGPLYAFTDTHIRIVGFVGVAIAGAALAIVFYAVLLMSLPGAQRRAVLTSFRGSVGQLRGTLH
jgi:hypothetical protein